MGSQRDYQSVISHTIACFSLVSFCVYRLLSLLFGSQQERREVKTTGLGRVSLPAAERGAVQALALVEPVGLVPALVLQRQELRRGHQG